MPPRPGTSSTYSNYSTKAFFFFLSTCNLFEFVSSIILWEQLSLLSKWWITHFGIKHFNWALMWSQWFWSCDLHQMTAIWWHSQDRNILILLQPDECAWIWWNKKGMRESSQEGESCSPQTHCAPRYSLFRSYFSRVPQLDWAESLLYICREKEWFDESIKPPVCWDCNGNVYGLMIWEITITSAIREHMGAARHLRRSF